MMCKSRCVAMVAVILVLFGLVHFTSGQGVTSPGCEVLQSPKCINYVNYTHTKYPNFVGNQNSGEADLDLNQFTPFIEIGCSPFIGQYLCAVYHPYCDSDIVKMPCQSVCNAVFDGCSTLLTMFGFPLPEILNCTLFPQQDCIEFSEETTTIMPSSTETSISTMSAAVDTTVCEALLSETCHNYVTYNQTSYPNHLGDSDQASAENTLNEMAFLLQSQCSDYVPLFLCSLVHPKCGMYGRIPPCQSLCQAFYDGCQSVIAASGVEWLSFLSCSNFPELEGSELCVSSPGQEREEGTSQCESVTVEMCKDFYNETSLPNMVGDQTQSDASSTLQNFQALISLGCSDYLPLLICSMYLPKCDERGVVSPCQSLCERVRDDCQSMMDNFGIKWPLDCRVTFVFNPGSSPECISEENLTEQPLAKDNQCESVTVEMCKDFYNETSLPNVIGDQTQSNASSTLQTFQAFISLGCSDYFPLLICSMYLPKCDERGVVKPCQSLCERVRDDCQSMMDNLEIPWTIDCGMTFLFTAGSSECISIDVTMTTEAPISTTTPHPGCPDPGYLANGNVNIISGSSDFPADLWSQLSFSCNPGYSLIGAPVATCQFDSTWSLSLPQCIADCKDPGSPAHGFQIGRPNFRAYTTVSFDCDGEYTLSGAHIITCNEGEWSHPLPVCTVFCEAIRIAQCKDLSYSQTGFPNFAGHSSQSEAGNFLVLYSSILSSPCDRNLQLLLCSAFVPPCDRGNVLPPCQTFCQNTYDSCIDTFQKEDLSWPVELNCSILPDNSDQCLSTPHTTLTTLPATQSPSPISTTTSQAVTTKEKKTVPVNVETTVSTDTHDTMEPTKEDTSRRGYIRCKDDTYADGYCMNGGTCFQVTVDNIQEQQCICHGNFTGDRCENKVLTKAEKNRLEKEEKKRNIAIGVGIAIACLVVLAIIIVVIIICRKHMAHKTHYFSSRPDSAVFTNPAYDDVTMTRKETDSFKQTNTDDSFDPDESKSKNFYEPNQGEADGVVENKFTEPEEVQPAPYCEPVEDEPSSPGSESLKVKGHSPFALDNPSYESFHYPSQDDTVIDKIKSDKF